MKRSIVFAALAGLFALTCASALVAAESGKVKFPGTEPGKRAAAYIKAFNEGSEAKLRAFLEANISPGALKLRPLDQRMETLMRLRGELGPIEPARIVAGRENEITVTASSAKGRWIEMVFGFEKAAPYKLIGVRFDMLDEPPDLDAPTTPLTEEEVIQETKKYIDGLVAKDDFSGVVLIARGETPVFSQAYGLASREYNVPNRLDTRFNLGSINKIITRIAVEQLVAKGAVSYDDRLEKYLPDYPNKDAREKVTVRELVDMTSGVGDFFGERFAATPKNEIRSLADYLPLFAEEPLHFEPGTKNEYSNGGYVLLGLIVEKASGKSYFDYVQENIYAPCGMQGTAHFEADVPIENVASGYTRRWDEGEHASEPRRNNIYTRPARGSSAGGGYSTADDLLRLVLALEAGRLSAPETARNAASGFGIAGGAPGINASVETFPQIGYTVIVLSNYDPPTAVNAGRRIGALLKRLG